MVNWSEKDIVEWEEKACEEQNAFCQLLGDRRWDRIGPNDGLILRRKIGYGLYGPPSRNPNSTDNNDVGYTSEEDIEINKIYTLIIDEGKLYENRGHTWFACIFVSCKMYDKRFTFPVFRILKNYAKDNYDKNNCTFIDHTGRVYESWEDYILNNTLPACLIIYPKDGIYQLRPNGKVDCLKARSCACYVANRAVGILDYTAAAAGLGASAIGLAAICAVPIAGPIMATAVGTGLVTSTYGFIRSSTTLIDRYMHKQSISLDNSESINCWLSIVATPLFFTQFGMIAHMKNTAEAGEIMCKAARITYSVVNIASFTTSGLGILHSLTVIIDKGINNTLTPLDVYQFTASCVFFTNSVMNFQTASDIIKKFQQEHINSYKEYLNSEENRRNYDDIVKKMQGEHKMHNNAKIIKSINFVENKEEFINSLLDADKTHNFEKGSIVLDKGLVNVLDEWNIHPTKLHQMDVDSVQNIIKNTKDLQSGKINIPNFKSNLSKICSKYRLHSKSMRDETITKLKEHFNVSDLSNFKLNGVAILKDMNGPDIDRVGAVMENTAKNCKSEIIDIALKFAEKEKCGNAREFCNYLEYCVNYMNDEKHRHLDTYKKNPKAYENFSGKQKTHFEQFVYKDFLDNESKINKMCDDFNKTKITVSQANATSQPRFKSDVAATYHYVKHKDDLVMNNNDLSAQEYLDIARKIAKTDPNSMMLSQEGDVTYLTFKDSDGRMVIGIRPKSDESCHIATCYRVRK